MNKTSSKKFNVALIAIIAFSLSSCSYFDVNHTVKLEVAPSEDATTQEIVDATPNGLQGDIENARYTSERLRNNDEN
jgi:hypothetical protein